MSDNDYALSISTEVKRPKIAIDGKVYELRINEDFGIRDSAFLQEAGKKINNLGKKATKEMSQEEAGLLSDMLDAVVRKVVIDLPVEMFSRLNDYHKTAIVNTFSEAVELSERIPQPDPSGESSPPGSSDSTEAKTPDAG